MQLNDVLGVIMKIDQYHEGIHGDDECEMDTNRTYSRQEIEFSVGY